MTKEYYEVDLRSRMDGNTVDTVYSGDSYDKAWEVRNAWFKENLPDWDDNRDVNELIDGRAGVFAYVYCLGEKDERLGGKA